MNTHVDLILRRRWPRFRDEFKAPEVDKETFAQQLYDFRIIDKSVSFFNPWLSIFDEAAFLLKLEGDLLVDWGDSSPKKAKSLLGVAFLVHKALTEALSFRLLVLAGYEDSGRVLLRTMMESLDLALLFFTDQKLARLFWADKSRPTTFWHEHLSHGRGANRFKELVAKVAEQRKHLRDQGVRRGSVYAQLSEQVHSSPSASVRAYAHPSIEHPGLLAVSPFGRLGAQAPGVLVAAYGYVITHADIFIHCILGKLQVFDLDRKKFGPRIAQIIARFNLFHEVASLFEKDLRRLERELKLE